MSGHPNETRCADCGRIISKYRGMWADREPREGRKYQNAYNFTCRYAISEDGMLVSADYHYVEGEERQPTWRRGANR